MVMSLVSATTPASQPHHGTAHREFILTFIQHVTYRNLHLLLVRPTVPLACATRKQARHWEGATYPPHDTTITR